MKKLFCIVTFLCTSLFLFSQQSGDSLYTVKSKPFPLGLLFTERWTTINNQSHMVNEFQFRLDFLAVLLVTILLASFLIIFSDKETSTRISRTTIWYCVGLAVLGILTVFMWGKHRNTPPIKLYLEFGTYIALYAIACWRIAVWEQKRHGKEKINVRY
jgi:hypothetical protein